MHAGAAMGRQGRRRYRRRWPGRVVVAIARRWAAFQAALQVAGARARRWAARDGGGTGGVGVQGRRARGRGGEPPGMAALQVAAGWPPGRRRYRWGSRRAS
ncbi:MAG TPA: hypothetical protein VH599_10015 [Ktedonobacterales bacterium]